MGGIFLLVFLIFIILLFYRTKYNNGESGLTNRLIANYEKSGAKILNNVYIPYGNNKTTEIDAVMVYRSGIYVFENKNYSGWIFGNSKNRYWTETFYSKRFHEVEKHQFYNPVMQNASHISCLKKYLNDYSIPMYNIVVFSNNCEFRNLTILDDAEVIYMKNLINTIEKIDHIYLTHCDEISADRINSIYNRLLNCTNVSYEIKKKHIDDIRRKYN